LRGRVVSPSSPVRCWQCAIPQDLEAAGDAVSDSVKDDAADVEQGWASARQQSPARHVATRSQDGRVVMLYWALVFFVVALIAGALGFGGIASASAGIAQVLFVIFLILLVASLLMHFLGARRRRV
jgi:uncharacterized membrane protein YtjA (UPF0391 family)